MASQGEALRAACGEAFSSDELSRSELRNALLERRVLAAGVMSNYGDHEAHYYLAGLQFSDRGRYGSLIVYPRPVPDGLRTGNGLADEPGRQWESENDVFLALQVAPAMTAIAPAGSAPLPREQIAAIAAHPDDDAPRLVAADSLQAAGDVRGELIQLQCKPIGRGTDPLQRGRIEAAIERLMTGHLQRWREVHGLVGRPFRFNKGFFEGTAASPGSGGLKALEPVFERSPIIELEVRGKVFHQLLDHPVLAQLRSLSIERVEVTAAELARLPAQLRSFSFGAGVELSRHHLEEIAGAPFAAQLERLELFGLGDETAKALLVAPLPRLRELVLPLNVVRTQTEAMRERFGSSWQETKPPA